MSNEHQDERLSPETVGALYQSVYGLMRWEVDRPSCFLRILALFDAHQDDLNRAVMIELCEGFCFMASEGFDSIVERFKRMQLADEQKPGTDLRLPGDPVEAKLADLLSLPLPADVLESVNDIIGLYHAMFSPSDFSPSNREVSQ